MPPQAVYDAGSSEDNATPTVEDGQTRSKQGNRWRQHSIKRAKAFGKAGFHWAKKKTSASSQGNESSNEESNNIRPKKEPSQTLMKANQIWTWVKGDNPLPGPRPPKQKHTYPRQDIHREDSICVRDPKDVGAQIWEWIIGENPIAPKSASKDTCKKAHNSSTPTQRILGALAGKSLIGNINNNTIRTAWTWFKGDNPLSPPKAPKTKRAKKPKVSKAVKKNKTPKMKWLKMRRKHKTPLSPVNEGDEPAGAADAVDQNPLSEEE